MNTLRRCLRLLSALALCLAAAAAVLPAAAQVMAARNGTGAGAQVHLVCSAQGTRWVDDKGADVRPGSVSTLGGWFDHCPLCQAGHAGGLPLPDPAVGLPAAPRYGWLPAAWLQAPRTAHAWLTAAPRGPPFFG